MFLYLQHIFLSFHFVLFIVFFGLLSADYKIIVSFAVGLCPLVDEVGTKIMQASFGAYALTDGAVWSLKITKIMASDPITPWQIEEEKVKKWLDFLLWASKMTADGDCTHEIR